jgi:hypothetical protein
MGGGTLQIDDSYHAVLWLKKFPQKMYPDHLRRLFQIDVPYLSVALIGKTRPYGTEYGILDRYLSLRGDVESKVGVVHKGPRWEDRERRIAERQQMLYRSRYSMDYNILVALHHIDRQGLEEAVDTALQEISLGNMRADRVTDTEWLLPFLLAATTGIDIGML